MFKPLSLFVAVRYLGAKNLSTKNLNAKNSTRFISFVSLTSIIALTLGVAILIIVLSIMNGFGAELRERILGTIPHGAVLYQPDSAEKGVDADHFADPKHWPQLREQLLMHEDIQGAAPLVRIKGMATYYGRVAGSQVYGVEPQLESTVSTVEEHLVPPLQSLSILQPKKYQMIVGQGLANQLGLVLGDKLTLVLPETQVTPAGLLPRYKRFTIAGFFEAGADIDNYLMFIHWQDAAKLLRTPNEVEGVRVRFDDLFTAPKRIRGLTEELNSHLGGHLNEKHQQRDGFISTDWTETHGTLFQAVKMEKTMVMLLLLLIVAVASFNMISSFVMMVSEKRSDIAILLTMGASPKQVSHIFLLQGVVIGIIGIGIGAATGIWVATHITAWVSSLESVLGAQFFSAFFVNYLPSIVEMQDVGVVVLVTSILCLIATWVPAAQALRVEPVDALRYE